MNHINDSSGSTDSGEKRRGVIFRGEIRANLLSPGACTESEQKRKSMADFECLMILFRETVFLCKVMDREQPCELITRGG